MTKSIFNTTRWDARPWLVWFLGLSLTYLLLHYGSRQWYNAGYAAGYQSVIMYYVDTIPVMPDSIVCKQRNWMNEQ